MKRLHIGNALFWIFFVPYVACVVIFLVAGLAPSVVKEFGGLHRSLHDFGDEPLRSEQEVTLAFVNHNAEHAHRLVIVDADDRRVFVGDRVPAHGTTEMTFVAPAPGWYRLTSLDDPALEQEIHFAPGGADELRLQLQENRHVIERVDADGWDEVARRVAGASHRADHGGRVTLETLFSMLNLGLGIVLIVRRPRDRTARLLAVAMIGTAATFNHQSHSMVRDYLIGDWWFVHDMFHLFSGIAYAYAVIVFPDGKLLPLHARHPALLRVAYGVATWILASLVLDTISAGHPGQPFFTVLFGLLIPFVGVGAQTYRLNHATDPVVRQQSRLLRWALLPMFFFGLLYLVLTSVLESSWIEDVGLAIFPALFALVPVALVMGILRYRLWDIDVLVSRTLLSVGLAAFIGAVYVVVVVLLGHGLGPSGSVGVKILATAIVAVVFEPVHQRLARFANRLVYGKRATPYEVMTEFSKRLAGAISVEQILPRLAETAVAAVGGTAGKVTAFLPGGGSRTVEWPDPNSATAFPYGTPVSYRGEHVGDIAVATAHSERLRPDEEALLSALAAQAGLAVNNARLTIELQARLHELSAQASELRASRQRIVTAREAQRQQVVQLIHERVETRLQHAGEDLIELDMLFVGDPDDVFSCIDALLAECGEALDALRSLARGIFPAILADQGIVNALDAYVLQAQLPIDVRLDALDTNERFDPQAEATVYFCMIQALANAGVYASGSNVVARVRADHDRMTFSIVDDGPGVDPGRLRDGADIHGMRDRVEAIGGEFAATSTPGRGTTISGWVPACTPALV